MENIKKNIDNFFIYNIEVLLNYSFELFLGIIASFSHIFTTFYHITIKSGENQTKKYR